MTELMIKVGDALHWLKQMAPDSINCVITSPPYFGLRDYGTAVWEGGSPDCTHRPSDTPAERGIASSTLSGGKNHTGHKLEGFSDVCPRCDAKRVDSQIGLEKTFDDYVGKLVAVFGEVRRVLKGDGTLWLNMGDSYSAGGRGGGAKNSKQQTNVGALLGPKKTKGYQSKNLIGVPWRLAFALQADGWYLRQDIIWHKPNPMPESVRDRCTKAHEYIFLLTKSATYRFDADAIKEAAVGTNEHDLTGQGYAAPGQTVNRGNRPRASGNKTHKAVTAYEASDSEEHRTKAGLLKIGATAYAKRNKRSVWTITPEPFKEAHFATFPTKLVEPCMLAGSPVHGIVLDPFGGSGTVGVVAKRLKRHCVLLELNPAYAEIARTRIANS